MSNAVIAATGLFTPEQSVSNAELVDSYNTWADGWNARHAAQIEAGELEAKSHSSPEFIEKASGIKSRFVMDKAGVIDPVKVTRSALANAASIAALVLTTETLVADKPEDEDED